ncbi:MAG: alpha-mannosidase, partial [Synergistetes bacterium]|nr:alpha-mannosidase [Synergistota bacterium]
MRLFIAHHTHWDREWFLPAHLTSEWLIPLCERLISLCRENPSFRFILDGQTLILEDLRHVSPPIFRELKRFISLGNVLVGPYYCQVDWRVADGESLFRNLMLGLLDASHLGKPMMVGWLLDNFGHPSQSPQIHSIFGIRDVFLWRGSYKISSEFRWCAPDGSEVLTIFLYGGYRSLYGLGRIPELIKDRIKGEVGKMRYQLTDNLILLDGYDLDLEPEDSSRFLPDR